MKKNKIIIILLTCLSVNCISQNKYASEIKISNECKINKELGEEIAISFLEKGKLIFYVDFEEYYSGTKLDTIIEEILSENDVGIRYYIKSSPKNDICEIEGFNEIMEPVLREKLSPNFLDSITHIAQQRFIDELKVLDIVDLQNCESKIEIVEFGYHRPIVKYLQQKDSIENNSFHFVGNFVGSSSLKFRFLINEKGRIIEFRILDRKYKLNEDQKQREDVEKFLKNSFLNKRVYSICKFQGEAKKTIKHESIAFRWVE